MTEVLQTQLELPQTEAALSTREILRTNDEATLGHVALELLDLTDSMVVKDSAQIPDNQFGMLQEIVTGLQDNRESAAEKAQNMTSSLYPHQVAAIARITDRFMPPKSLLDSFGAQSGAELVGKVLDTPAKGVGAQNVMEFFEWQTAAAITRQKIFEKRELPVLLSEVDTYLRRGVEGDVLPVTAYNKFQSMKDEGKLEVTETLYLPLRSKKDGHIAGCCAKYCDGSAAIFLSLDREPGDSKTGMMVTHEALHAIVGVDTKPNKGRTYDRENTGLFRVFGGGDGGLAVEEAVTQHTTDGLIRDNIDVVDPYSSERANSTSYYSAQRALLHVLCTTGIRNVHPRLFTAAMLEDGDGGEGSQQEALTTQLEEAFPGMDIVERISSFVIPEDGDVDQVVHDIAMSIETDAMKMKHKQERETQQRMFALQQ